MKFSFAAFLYLFLVLATGSKNVLEFSDSSKQESDGKPVRKHAVHHSNALLLSVKENVSKNKQAHKNKLKKKSCESFKIEVEQNLKSIASENNENETKLTNSNERAKNRSRAIGKSCGNRIWWDSDEEYSYKEKETKHQQNKCQKHESPQSKRGTLRIRDIEEDTTNLNDEDSDSSGDFRIQSLKKKTVKQILNRNSLKVLQTENDNESKEDSDVESNKSEQCDCVEIEVDAKSLDCHDAEKTAAQSTETKQSNVFRKKKFNFWAEPTVWVMTDGISYPAKIIDLGGGKFTVEYDNYKIEHDVLPSRIFQNCGENEKFVDAKSLDCPGAEKSTRGKQPVYVQQPNSLRCKEKLNFWAQKTVYVRTDRISYPAKIIGCGKNSFSVEYEDYGVEHDVHPSRIFRTRPKCSKCCELDHIVYDCPEVKCKSCFENGHISSKCPNRNRRCIVCKSKGHNLHNCPQKNAFDEKKLKMDCIKSPWGETTAHNGLLKPSNEDDERNDNPDFESPLKRKLDDHDKESYILNEIASQNVSEYPKSSLKDIYDKE